MTIICGCLRQSRRSGIPAAIALGIAAGMMGSQIRLRIQGKAAAGQELTTAQVLPKCSDNSLQQIFDT